MINLTTRLFCWRFSNSSRAHASRYAATRSKAKCGMIVGHTILLGAATTLCPPATAQLRPLAEPLPPSVPSWSFDENDHSPDWSPDGRQILVTRRSPARSYQLYLANADGTALRMITQGPGNNQQGTFSPSGDRIAFLSDRDGSWAIYVMSIDGSSLRRLTRDSASVGERPAWSPDGSRIAYYSNRNGHLDIWVMNADGTNHVALTNDSIPDANPSWSPDGRFIAFDRTDGDREIWRMRVDGQQLRRLTHHAGYDGYPAWSPDGSRIAFIANYGDRWNIYTMSADGSDQRQLTDAPSWNFDPEWSPDGSQIVFDSRRDGRRGTYVMNADGSHLRKITNVETSEFVIVARALGAAEAVRRFHVAKLTSPGATFFLPTEVELVVQDLIAARRMREAALLLDAALDHQPMYSGLLDELREVHAALGHDVPPVVDTIRAVFRNQGVAAGLTLLYELQVQFPNWPVLSLTDFENLTTDALTNGSVDDAVRTLRAGIARYPESAVLQRRIAELYFDRGDESNGISHLSRARELAPDDMSIRKLANRFGWN